MRTTRKTVKTVAKASNSDTSIGQRRGEREPKRWLDPAVAQVLRSGRLRRGWSFRTAGRETGVAFGYLCLLEHGKRVPSVAVAEALVKTYGLTASEAALLRSVALEGVGRSFDPSRYEAGTWFGT